MDNQQENAEALSHWLGGFLDGEGSFYTKRGRSGYTQVNGERHQYVHYQPGITVVNTHIPTLRIVEAALDHLGLPYHVEWRKPQRANQQISWGITIRGWKRCLHAAQALLPYLRTKREQCENMLELCHNRLQTPLQGPKGLVPYTSRQMELIMSLRGRSSASRRSDSSETER